MFLKCYNDEWERKLFPRCGAECTQNDDFMVMTRMMKSSAFRYHAEWQTETRPLYKSKTADWFPRAASGTKIKRLRDCFTQFLPSDLVWSARFDFPLHFLLDNENSCRNRVAALKIKGPRVSKSGKFYGVEHAHGGAIYRRRMDSFRFRSPDLPRESFRFRMNLHSSRGTRDGIVLRLRPNQLIEASNPQLSSAYTQRSEIYFRTESSRRRESQGETTREKRIKNSINSSVEIENHNRKEASSCSCEKFFFRAFFFWKSRENWKARWLNSFSPAIPHTSIDFHVRFNSDSDTRKLPFKLKIPFRNVKSNRVG